MIDQERIHNHCINGNPEERINALTQLQNNFLSLPNKEKAWNDLHKLTSDKDSFVRYRAASALGSVFSNVPDKQQAWNDLHRLTYDEGNDVRWRAASALKLVFSDVPDKQLAWNDLHRLTSDKDSSVRYWVTSALGSVFSDVPNKQQALNDLHKLTYDEDCNVRWRVADVLGSVFSNVLDKQQAWSDLHRLTYDEDSFVRSRAASAIISMFYDIPDKQLIWSDLHKLTYDEDSFVKYGVASTLGSVFSDVPNKQLAWNDLIRLASDEDSKVRFKAASALGSVISDVLDKQQAWNDLIKLTSDEDGEVRWRAASALKLVFSDVPDKQQAWNDLHRLTFDKDRFIRLRAASALGSSFSNVPNKQQAWDDLIRLTSDEDGEVRSAATSTLGSVFSNVPDKQQALNDLHRLTSDKDSFIRLRAASALGSAFFNVPDKQQAWNDLHRLTYDEDGDVRIYANHSLGRASIFEASCARNDEDYKIKLEKAITYFEKAAQESKFWWSEWGNPAQFCLPFYRSFHTIIFKKQEAKEEVDRYLAEAKSAIEGSKGKKLLFEAIENLANALKEVQNLENLDLETKKGELNFYRKYCDRAVELMRDTEETAPFATVTIKKGLPILDRSLKELLEEIQKKAKIACKASKGTDTEKIACEINKKIQKWEVSNTEEMIQNIEDLAYILKNKVADIPENRYILNKIELMRHERDLNNQYKILLFVIPQIPTMKVIPEKELDNKFLKLDLIYDKTVSIETKLDLIQKTLDKGLEKLDMLSTEVGGREAELIQTFSKNILGLTEKGDKDTLKSFLEGVFKKENILIEEIEKSSASQEEKDESKNSILNIRSVLDKIKNPIKSFGKDVTKEIVVTYAAEELVKLVFQLMSMAALGVPIPPQILNLLSSMTKELKN